MACDLDGDRDVDLYVVNDTTPNFLYRNRGDGTFDEVGFSAGVALSAEGIVTGSMGVDAGDADGDGDFDLWVSNYEGETNELYRNDGEMSFTPIAMSVGLGAVSRPMVGWGTGLFDLDNDGRLDVFVANGHLMHHLPRTPLAQRPLLFHQTAEGRFEDVGAESGNYFADLHIGRGCAAGDLDNDGDLDLAIVHQNQPVTLLRNDSAPARQGPETPARGQPQQSFGHRGGSSGQDRGPHLDAIGDRRRKLPFPERFPAPLRPGVLRLWPSTSRSPGPVGQPIATVHSTQPIPGYFARAGSRSLILAPASREPPTRQENAPGCSGP